MKLLAALAVLAFLGATACDDNDSAPRYPDCAAVSSAGAAPLHKGDPGYSDKLDRDGDGTACDQ